MLARVVVASLLCAAAQALSLELPKLSGPLPVGTTAFKLVDHSRQDPLAPTAQPRELMISVFYPTSVAARESGNYSHAPAFSKGVAAAFDDYVGAPNGTAAQITSQSLLEAPLLHSKFPILTFGHGLGATRFLHIAQLEDLASYGWIIAAVDHTYDTLVVEFPDGKLVPAAQFDTEDLLEVVAEYVAIRSADMKFVVDSLRNSTLVAQIPGLNSCRDTNLDVPGIGIFGHSLGGAAAAQTMADHGDDFWCGANFDGAMYGSVAKQGLDDPFLLVGTPSHNLTSDPTWGEFWPLLSGFHKFLEVNGTTHQSFSDLPVLRDLVPDVFPANASAVYGEISGSRMLAIETALIDTFFSTCLKGQPTSHFDNLITGGTLPEVSEG